MKIELSKIERNTLLHWKEESRTRAGRYGGETANFPDEEHLAMLLKSHTGGTLELGINKAMILMSWAEDNVDRHFGRGAIVNVVERALLQKIQSILPIEGKAASTQSSRLGTQTQKPKRESRFDGNKWLPLLIIGTMLTCLVLFQKSATHSKSDHHAYKKLAGVLAYHPQLITGKVSYKRKNKWMPVNAGSQVISGDSIWVASESRLVLMHNHKKKWVIGENQKTTLP